MAFAVLSFSQLVHSFNVRSDGPVLFSGLVKNRFLRLSFFICAGMMLLVLLFPPMAALFGTASMPGSAWLVTAGLSLAPLPLCELQKRILKKR